MRPSTPQNQQKKSEVLEWEQLADQEFGVYVRRICYGVIIDKPSMWCKLWGEGRRFYDFWLFQHGCRRCLLLINMVSIGRRSIKKLFRL